MGKNNPRVAASPASQTTTNQSTATEDQKQGQAVDTNAKQDAEVQTTTQPDAGTTNVSNSTGDGASVSDSASTEQSESQFVQSSETKEILIRPTEQTVTVSVPAEPAKAIVVEEATAPVAENATTLEQLAKILKNVPGSHQIEINRILMYIERMAPNRPADQKVGLVEQVALYRAIQNIINRQDTYFTQLFTAVLFLFNQESDGALGDRYRMRFMDNVALHAGDRKAFANLTQMLHILADPTGRENMIKQVNMQRALENGLTEEGRTRVLNYFGV